MMSSDMPERWKTCIAVLSRRVIAKAGDRLIARMHVLWLDWRRPGKIPKAKFAES